MLVLDSRRLGCCIERFRVRVKLLSPHPELPQLCNLDRFRREYLDAKVGFELLNSGLLLRSLV